MKLLEELALPGCCLAFFWALIGLALAALDAPSVALWIAYTWALLGCLPAMIIAAIETWRTW